MLDDAVLDFCFSAPILDPPGGDLRSLSGAQDVRTVLASRITGGNPTSCFSQISVPGIPGDIYVTVFEDLTDDELLDCARDLMAINRALEFC